MGSDIHCLHSMAIHLEVLNDMSLDSFINCLRNLIAIRRPVKTFYLDNGTNFIGARNELDTTLNLVKDPELKEFLISRKTEFKTNPPEASHQGGVWERLIRTTRSVLNVMAHNYKGRWDSSKFRTALYEVMAIVNSRPISTDNINDPSEIIITPNHLVTLKNKTATPPGEFSSTEIY